MRSGVLPLKLFSFIECSKIFDTFLLSDASPIGVPGIFPGRDISASYETDIFFPRYPITTLEVRRIMTIFGRRNEAKIASSVVEPIPIDVVYKDPSARRFPYNVIMYKIRFIPSVPVVGKVKSLASIFVSPNIYIDFRVTHKFIFVIMQRGFNKIVVEYSLLHNMLSGYKGKGDATPCAFALGSSSCFSPFLNIFIWHKRIISRIKKFHNKEVYLG